MVFVEFPRSHWRLSFFFEGANDDNDFPARSPTFDAIAHLYGVARLDGRSVQMNSPPKAGLLCLSSRLEQAGSAKVSVDTYRAEEFCFAHLILSRDNMDSVTLHPILLFSEAKGPQTGLKVEG